MILRQCDRCKEWVQYADYEPSSHLCSLCALSAAPSIAAAGIYGIARSIRITPKGKALLLDLHRQEARQSA